MAACFRSAILAIFITVSKAEVLKYKLSDGNFIPAVALGTSLGHLSDGTRILPKDKLVVKSVGAAIESGYRHIDTASLYRVEDEVGEGVQNKILDGTVTREDVYITTKLWNDAHGRDEVIPALKESLKRLNMSYVDLYMVHYPMAYTIDGKISTIDYLETWQGMEDALAANLTRSVGVSNFNITQMERLYQNSRIKPAVLQIEVNPTLTQEQLTRWCSSHGVVVMAYSPFGSLFGRKPDAPPPRADDPLFRELGQKYNKTAAHIVLRYLLDRQLIPIPRSTNKERIKQNIDILDFALTPFEVDRISSFNKNYRLRTPAKWYPHPEFPFEKRNLTDSEIEYIIEHSKED